MSNAPSDDAQPGDAGTDAAPTATAGPSTPRSVQTVYLTLLLGNTLAASLIWGINTIFLLDAGLTNFEAFAANAFFTLGMVIFEVPTGVVADTIGRRASYLLGTVTLSLTTAFYVLLWYTNGPFWAWAISSVLIGLGFTFFSGAVEAWLVDALTATGYTGEMETVFGRGQIVNGVAMLVGSIGGGVIAQRTDLGVPYLVRAGILILMFVLAFRVMHDLGFTPRKGGRPIAEVKRVLTESIDHGVRVPAVKWLMFEAFFTGGVGIYVFYALQPYLLELWGDPEAYQVAGVVAALVGGTQILGGMVAPWVRRLFRRRTSGLIATAVASVATLAAIGLVDSFVAALVIIAVWGLISQAAFPIRRAYLNGLIPSGQRATILSFDSLVDSAGGVWAQPLLGRTADVWGYGPSFVASAGISALAIPFLAVSRRQHAPADVAVQAKEDAAAA